MALGVLIVAVVLLATGIVLYLRKPLALRLTEGDCIALSSGEGERVEPEPVECGDRQRYYQVTSVVEPPVRCAIGETVLATYTSRASEIAARRTCLIPSFVVDACYDVLDEARLAYVADGVEPAPVRPCAASLPRAPRDPEGQR